MVPARRYNAPMSITVSQDPDRVDRAWAGFTGGGLAASLLPAALVLADELGAARSAWIGSDHLRDA